LTMQIVAPMTLNGSRSPLHPGADARRPWVKLFTWPAQAVNWLYDRFRHQSLRGTDVALQVRPASFEPVSRRVAALELFGVERQSHALARPAGGGPERIAHRLTPKQQLDQWLEA